MIVPHLFKTAERADGWPDRKGRHPSAQATTHSPVVAIVRRVKALANPTAIMVIAVVLGAATTGAIVAVDASPRASSPAPDSPAWHQLHPVHAPRLPIRPAAYFGAYEPTSPDSYSGMKLFAHAVGRAPNLAL